MRTLLVVHMNVKDPESLKLYRESAGATLAPFGGKHIFSGKVANILEGSHDSMATVAIEFPNSEAVNNWYNSSAYQELKPLRKKAMDATFISLASQ